MKIRLRARARPDWRRRKRNHHRWGSALLNLATSTCTLTAKANSFNRCSTRSRKDTGIKVNVISASSGLEQRIKTEGANSPAESCSPSISDGSRRRRGRNHPTDQVRSAGQGRSSQYRDPEGHGTACPCARGWPMSKDRVPQTTLTYEESRTPNGKARICIRSGQHIYNNALIAAYIAHHGEAKTEEWLEGRQGQPCAETVGRRP